MRVNFFHDMSVRYKLILMNFLIIIPLSILGIVAYKQISLIFENKVNEYSTQIVRQINSKIDYYVEEMNKVYLLINSNEVINPSINKTTFNSKLDELDKYQYITQYLTDLKTFQNFPCNIYYYNNLNESYSTTVLQIVNVEGIRNYKWLKDLIKDDTSKSMVMIDRLFNRDYVYFVKKVYDLNTKLAIGVVVIESPISIIENEINKINLGKSSIIIISNDNNIIYSLPRDGSGSISREISSLSNKKHMNMKVNGEDYLAFSDISNLTNWKVTGAIPVRLLFADFEEVKRISIIIGSLCIIITLLISFLVAHTISKPIGKLRKLMKTAEEGNFSAVFSERRNDEIGQLGTSFNKMLTKINGLINEVYEVQLKEKEAELNALQSQINPHFLYNTLQSISMRALLNDDMDVVDMLNVLVSYFRYSVNRGREMVEIAKEIEHLENYIKIQSFRFKDKFNIFMNVDKEIYNCRIIKLCLQPMVENSIIHGLEGRKGNGVIIITGRREKDIIAIRVVDDGRGMDADTLEKVKRGLENSKLETDDKSAGIGLRNVHQRIRLYFGGQYGIKINSEPNKGTEVDLVFPVINGEVENV